MQSYIDQAEQFISPKITGIIRRNRVIARAVNIFILDPDNFSRLYEWVQPDVIQDKIRAEHHGVPIGTQIGWIKSPRDTVFYSKVAKVKKEFRTLMLGKYS